MKLLLIDANSIANRCFYAIRPLSNKKGVFTHAITGFFNTYLKLTKKYSPDAVVAAFDMRAPTFRKEMFAEYKANRKGMPDDLAVQIPYIKEILNALGVTVLEKEGFEADDIIGTLSHHADLADTRCVIATGDRDALQLVTDNVTLHLSKTKEDVIYTPKEIEEQFGLEPAKLIDVKALQGDSSDNIPGVAGIGEKTALALIQKYGGLDYIYEHIEVISLSATNYKKLNTGKEMAFLSRKLGEINKQVPISTTLTDYHLKNTDNQKLTTLLTELEMFALIKKISNPPGEPPVATAAPAVAEREKPAVIYNNSQADFSSILFKNNNNEKQTFNIKSLWKHAAPNEINLKNVTFDTTLAAYLLNANANDYSLPRLCDEYGVNLSDNPVGAVQRLNELLSARIEQEGLQTILKNIEIPLSEVLVCMEQSGIKLDTQGLENFGAQLKTDIADVEQKIFALSQCEFNVSSPKQLGLVLFETLKLPGGKKTKTGYSTNADVLESLTNKHPIIPLIGEYRTLTKLNSTYVEGLLKQVSPTDSRIRTTFKQTETRTGRISSTEPNLQNIPVRTARGREMRKFFIADEGKILVDADYSQIELRVLAHMSGDELMQKAFADGADIHTITAAQVFNQPPEWVTPEMRTAAKAVNFGIVYGIGAFSLSKDIGVSVAQADSYIKNYLEKYHGVRDFMECVVRNATQNGYVETLFGRRRYIPELRSSNKNIQSAGKRMAMNTPIQGTAADIIKLAMLSIHRRLKEEALPAKLIMQVHDELIVECDEGVALRVKDVLKEEMEKVEPVALVAQVKTARSWYESH
ncbi:MAG: DNA polymerase I [Oscillospiraceae bacterium]|nr:DNA polymerase I [Oscillospiraceae bacterium]